MPFASIHFLFIFLPIVFLLFYIIPKGNWRNVILVVASLGFFGWTDLAHLPLLIGLVLINFLYGLLIDRFIEKKNTLQSSIHIWIAVTINLLVLCFYKYLGFFAENIQAITHITVDLSKQSLPLGISYFTFSGISYLVDINNGVEKAERNLIRFSAFLIMFPKLLQGPITRFGHVKNELLNPHFISTEVMQGVRRFIVGLAKKVILADSLGIAANKVFGADISMIGAGVAWYGLIAFTSANLLRFFRLYRYGGRFGKNIRFQTARKLQLSLHQPKYY